MAKMGAPRKEINWDHRVNLNHLVVNKKALNISDNYQVKNSGSVFRTMSQQTLAGKKCDNSTYKEIFELVVKSKFVKVIG